MTCSLSKCFRQQIHDPVKYTPDHQSSSIAWWNPLVLSKNDLNSSEEKEEWWNSERMFFKQTVAYQSWVQLFQWNLKLSQTYLIDFFSTETQILSCFMQIREKSWLKLNWRDFDWQLSKISSQEYSSSKQQDKWRRGLILMVLKFMAKIPLIL